MNALPMSLSAPSQNPQLALQLRRYLPLIIVIALHVGLFYALRGGLVHQVAQTLPREIIASFVTLEPPPEPKPQPAPPKTVPVVKKPVAQPKPRPVISEKPAEKAITEEVPPEAPQQESKEPPAVFTPPAPAAPAAPALPKTISGVSYINAPRPVYPPLDARMGNEGTVTLRVLINEKGKAERIEIQKSSGSLRMDDAARDAVMRALFKPYIEDGRPTPAFAIVPINFTLNR
ncbi:MAG: TonB family protein [Oxalicibacterium faecigallinarum]|uniref:Protein TonB n=1 Tax=Oxalicibacterium faecigallinarum TaxID=573741 RepID=A0A8J3ARX4_9BURK|nr:energy transducer TonB [Oxalicibacterium faecigallinarum]MDQ7968948.1 TonB family protein [Oxalicibacterium faecigallinarum]GGI21289.1 cell envelope biogenesis protein TonB [Oxalicibacterium faecigallinarum]